MYHIAFMYHIVLMYHVVQCIYASYCGHVDRKKPPPPRGFLFTMFRALFPHQEPWVRGPPSKHLVQILWGGSSSSGFLMREHSKQEPPPGGFFRSMCTRAYSHTMHLCIILYIHMRMYVWYRAYLHTIWYINHIAYEYLHLCIILYIHMHVYTYNAFMYHIVYTYAHLYIILCIFIYNTYIHI